MHYFHNKTSSHLDIHIIQGYIKGKKSSRNNRQNQELKKKNCKGQINEQCG